MFSRPGVLAALVIAAALSGCTDPSTGTSSTQAPATAAVRAARRAFAGAPPVIPHPPLSGTCASCHTPTGGREVSGIGIAPANPHTKTPGMSESSRCRQCHVFRMTEDLWKTTEFTGLKPDSTHGDRMFTEAPPVTPHPLFMREDCTACHAGTAARPEITCRHASRDRCQQCHVHQHDAPPFSPPAQGL